MSCLFIPVMMEVAHLVIFAGTQLNFNYIDAVFLFVLADYVIQESHTNINIRNNMLKKIRRIINLQETNGFHQVKHFYELSRQKNVWLSRFFKIIRTKISI
jgi:hypothetical protein